jgi:hypothetical protein
MQTFSTEFPVHDDATGEKFIETVKVWILASRYTHFQGQDLMNVGGEGESRSVVGNDSIEILRLSNADTDSIAVTYHKRDGDCDWITRIVYSENPSSTWVSVRVLCEPHHLRAKLPQVKKPVLMQTLLDLLGGGNDGDLMVSDRPVLLNESEIERAVTCILGTSRTYLPVVYISSPFKGPNLIDADALAKKLVGMAHVIVEPSRAFSIRLKSEVQAQNVYGGAVGIYWPEGGGIRKFIGDRGYEVGPNVVNDVFEEIRLALNNRRPLTRCTWNAIKELQSRKILNELREAGSTDINNYIEVFDAEMKAKDEALNDAEKEIQRLNAEIRRFESHVPNQIGLAISTGQETEYYSGEIFDIVIDALEISYNGVTEDSRRQHVLKEILLKNISSGTASEIKERIKGTLRKYTGLDAKTQRELLELGFSITDSGKHHKLMWNQDERYTFALAKTPSDHRTGLNSALDICRLFF